VSKRKVQPQNSHSQVARHKKGNKLKLWLGFTGVATLSAIVGAILAVSLSSTPLLQHQLRPDDAAVFNGKPLTGNTIGLPEVTRPVNILVLGMSVLPDDIGKSKEDIGNIGYEAQMHSVEGLSDTMLLLRFDPNNHNLTTLSIPRDSRIVLEKYGIQKINAANVIGGPSLAAQEVSKLLNGVSIDRYLRVNVLAVGQIVDTIGGLNIYIPKDMKYKDDSQHLYINLKQGFQHLNGDQIMQLLRFRHDENGDIGRIQRQQMVMRALIAQALNPKTIARIPQLIETIKSDIDTNMSVEESMALIGFARGIDSKHLQGLIVPGRPNGDGRNEISYWLPDYEKIGAMMAKYFETEGVGTLATNPDSIRVSIQDGSNNPQALKVLVQKLRAVGYNQVSIATPLPEQLRVTKIVAQQGDADSAHTVSQTLGFGQVSVETSGTLYSDITIQLGTDGAKKLVHAEVGL
jgi:LCP family protein required for cell wall assembly